MRKPPGIVEVLGRDEFEKFHLPGAINLPTDENFEHEIQEAVPDKPTPVAVYCTDENCTASPEAARQMEEPGYEPVYGYTADKMDCKNAGLPVKC